jgi:hypothetical protein
MNNIPMSRKEIAALVGIAPRTMRKYRARWLWIEKYKTGMTLRPTYNRKLICEQLIDRGMI